MILYLDTSALVKLFVEEAHSAPVRKAVAATRLVTTHTIAYVESCAAFARFAHARGEAGLFSELRRNLDIQWEGWEVLSVTDTLLRRAADLAGRYRLRGYDSVHLATAESVFEVFRGQTDFRFAVFDGQLRDTAEATGIPLLEA
jgi:uncharacterized protein